jgi:capsular exopolysaccharide synthesis family protein
LAISIAQTGKRVVLVDADFRRPRIHQHIDEPISPGTLDVLDGQLQLDHVLISSFQPNLDLLASGGRPKNPGELVTSPEFNNLILELKSRYDFVLLDSPPLLPVADATAMSTEVDGVYLVLRIRKGVKVSARSAKERLDQVNANVLGVIVNGMDQNPHYSEYGYYYYAYNTDFRRYYDAPSTVDSPLPQTARRATRIT